MFARPEMAVGQQGLRRNAVQLGLGEHRAGRTARVRKRRAAGASSEKKSTARWRKPCGHWQGPTPGPDRLYTRLTAAEALN